MSTRRLSLPVILVIADALMMVTLLTAVTVTGDTGTGITAAMVVEAAKGTDPSFGLQILADAAEKWHHRANVLRWIGYALVPLLFANALAWALLRDNSVITTLAHEDESGTGIKP